MPNSGINTNGLVKNISHLAENLESLLNYVYEEAPKNTRLRNSWQEIYHKVIHGLILTSSLKNLVEKIEEGNTEKDVTDFSLLLAEKLGDSLLLVCEIYKRMYADWLKYLTEPSIMHKGVYTNIKKIQELKEMPIFVTPTNIENDTHEIARRVVKNKTLFNPYDTHMLFRILADAKTVTYIAYNKDKLVTVRMGEVDPKGEIDFLLIGKALERLIIWRNQFAHFGDYLLACNEIFKSLSIQKKSKPNFDQFKEKVFGEFSSRSQLVIRYLSRLFWYVGDAIKILKESCEKIDKVFNYHLQKAI